MDEPSIQQPTRVLAVLDDTFASESLIEWSTALAHALQRDLALVYVESTAAMAAATLPFTQVLAHAGAEWSPFDPQDVERGYRAHTARLRTLAQRVTLGRAVRWSLRTVRGVMPEAAFAMLAEGELLFVAAPARAALRVPAGPPRRDPRPPIVAVLCDDSEAGARGIAVGGQLARALSGSLQVVHLPRGITRVDEARLLGSQSADLLVLPPSLATAPKLVHVSCPVLVVA